MGSVTILKYRLELTTRQKNLRYKESNNRCIRLSDKSKK